jgi:hypothetical protein
LAHRHIDMLREAEIPFVVTMGLEGGGCQRAGVNRGSVVTQCLSPARRRPAHTALGDVLTVIDLMQQVLRPLAEKRGLDTWEKIVAFAGDEWFPSRLSFGKFKGRLYQEAREDAELRAWLEWLAESTNERSSGG